jgi:hypothetical protein
MPVLVVGDSLIVTELFRSELRCSEIVLIEREAITASSDMKVLIEPNDDVSEAGHRNPRSFREGRRRQRRNRRRA